MHKQTKQASLTSFVENTNKRHADDTQSTSNLPSPLLTNSQTTNMAATSPVTPVLEAATTPNNTTDTSNAEVTNNDIKLLLLQLERRLSQGMSDMNSQLSDKIDDVKSTVNRLTDRVEKVESENVELHNRISECEKITSRTDNLSEKISELEAKLEYNELRDRKYNILIYGLPEKTLPQNENTEELVREFVCNSLRLGKHYSDNIAICNTHRLPRKNRNAADAVANGPPAIIVKLATMRTRDELLQAARNIPRGTKISVRTDLPPRLKEKRSRLAKKAYEMRQTDKNIRTRIRESIPQRDVWLEYLNIAHENAHWTRLNEQSC